MKIIGPTSNPPEPKPATFGAPPPWERDPVATTEAPESAPSLMDHVQNYAALFDTSRQDSIPEPGWKAQQRQTATRERPVVRQETWTSRKLRRARGDYRRLSDIQREES